MFDRVAGDGLWPPEVFIFWGLEAGVRLEGIDAGVGSR